MTSENLIEEAAKAIFFRGEPVDPRQWGHMQDGMRIVAREQARAAIQMIVPAVLEREAKGREEQAREIERLRKALQMAADDCQFCRGNGSYLGFRPDTGENLWDDCPDCKPFRAALAGDSNDQ